MSVKIHVTGTPFLCTHPRHRDCWDEDARTKPLEQRIGQRFEDGVDQEEDGEPNVVLVVAHVQIFLETLDLGIADVCSVNEGCQV